MTDEALLEEELQEASGTSTREIASKAWDEAVSAEEPVQDESRDEKGRFKPKAVEAEQPAVEEVSGQPTQQANEVQEEKPAPIIKAPVSWPAEKKALFAQLPPEAQRYIADREGERERYLHQKSEEAERAKGTYRNVEQVLAPRVEVWTREGVSPDAALKQLLAISDHASQDPVGFIKWFAERRGLNLSQLQNNATEADPVLQQATARLQTLEQRIAQREQMEREVQQQALLAQVKEFEEARDEHGNPKNPYFYQVRDYMAVLIDSGKAQDLQSAYDAACWANPDVRKAILEEQAEEQRAKAAAEAREKAAKAAKASVSLKSKGDAGSLVQAKGLSTREIASKLWDEAMGA